MIESVHEASRSRRINSAARSVLDSITVRQSGSPSVRWRGLDQQRSTDKNAVQTWETQKSPLIDRDFIESLQSPAKFSSTVLLFSHARPETSSDWYGTSVTEVSGYGTSARGVSAYMGFSLQRYPGTPYLCYRVSGYMGLFLHRSLWYILHGTFVIIMQS